MEEGTMEEFMKVVKLVKGGLVVKVEKVSI
jgi:hypothetical protein